MIVDFQDWTPQGPIECDVCVVGSGAAGLAIANELRGSRLRVVVLEAGGRKLETASQEPYRSVATGRPFPGAEAGRFRVFGGSTTQWGGQALPLSPMDFSERPWVASSGWPISYEEVRPFYRRAADFLSTDEFDFDDSLTARFVSQPPSFDPLLLRYHLSKWSPHPDLALAYQERLDRAENLTVILHASVTRIELEPDREAVESIGFSALGGKSAEVRAKNFVLCCGGIETARILLANRSQLPAGIGNQHDLVGRFFQDHPNGRLGMLQPFDVDHVQRLFNLFHRNGRKYSVRMSASPELQRKERILNCTASLMFDIASSSAAGALRTAYQQVQRGEFGRPLAQNLIRALGRPQHIARPIFEYYVRGRTYLPNPAVRVMINIEQEPDPESRVTLTDETDSLGMPRASVHWKLSDLCGETVRRFAPVLREQLRKAGVGELVLDPWVLGDGWQQNLADQYHHIGTTRMSESAATGVVDPSCRVHGVRNLYIGSSAVFPTGGHSNPTMTLIALSIRLADHLKQVHA